MQVSSKEIVLASGKKITQFELENDNHMKVEAISLGATLTKIIVPDHEGNFENVILGWQDLNVYEPHPGDFGAIVGRIGGRIAKGQATIDGKTYHFPINDNQNTLHGGKEGFHQKNWKGSVEKTEDAAILKLSYLSKDGEEGFPGNLNVTVTYTLTNDNELHLSYKGTTDKETIVNLTNHAYFNLSGDAKRDVLDEVVFIDAKERYELDHELIPTGKMITLKDDPIFDFSTPKKIGQDIEKEHKDLTYGCGYDHVWKLNQGKEAVKLYDEISRRELTITTTAPGVVMYTMNHADTPILLSNGKPQAPRYGVCFETQKAAIGYNEVNKEDVLLKPGEIYSQETTWSFKVK